MSDPTHQLAAGVRLVFATPSTARHFFGYYDKSPLDGAGERLLCHRVDFDGRLVEASDVAEVGFFDLVDGTFHRLGETCAFNWQQGSMLQWLGPDFTSRAVWNDRRRGRFVAVIQPLGSGARRELSTTVYSLDPKGRWAVTPRFERHAFCRPGYCYAGLSDERWNGDAPADDGILLVDLRDGSSRLVVSVRELMRHSPLPSMDHGPHYVEHMLFNPSGERFAFLHRWQLPDGGIYTRCHVCDADGGRLVTLPDGGLYSHGCWWDEDRFVITGRPPGQVSKIRYSSGPLKVAVRPFLQAFRRLGHGAAARWIHRTVTPDGYLLFADGRLESVGRDALPREGHPGFRPGPEPWMLTDTYPDDQGRQHLLAYHLEHRVRVDLGWFSTPASHRGTGFRSDLHPRWSRCGNRVVIDSLHGGERQVYVLDVAEALAAGL